MSIKMHNLAKKGRELKILLNDGTNTKMFEKKYYEQHKVLPTYIKTLRSQPPKKKIQEGGGLHD